MILAQAADPSVINKFKAGFTECATEVGRFGGIEPAAKRRLLQHLSSCLNAVKGSGGGGVADLLPSPPSSPDQNAGDKLMCGRHPVAAAPQLNQISLSSGGYFLSNGNGGGGGVGVQVIPTKLPNGNVAFVVPPGALQYQTSSPQGSTPLPMLIPIPVAAAARQSVANSSTSSSSTSSSSSSSASSTSSSSADVGHGDRHQGSRCSSNGSAHISHVTSSPYARSTGTPSSTDGSMSPVHGCPASRKRSRSSAADEQEGEERESECHSPGPLSLVVRKVAALSADEDPDKACWRPW